MFALALATGIAATGAHAGQGRPVITGSRITQGLERHGPASAPTEYDLIAGKDTLVRATFASPMDPIAAATCWMIEGARNVYYAAEIVSLGDAAGTYIASCWIPGAHLPAPSTKTFELRYVGAVSGAGWAALGTRSFFPTGDLRLLVAPWIDPPGYVDYQPWSDALALNVAEAMLELNRRTPTRTGVGAFSFTGAGAGGVRYHLALPALQCETRPGETVSAAVSRCAWSQFAQTDWIMRFYNGVIRRRMPGADLFDLAWAPWTTPVPRGGSGCNSGGPYRSFIGGLDPGPDSTAASVVVHEAAHCMGQVTAASPNGDGLGEGVRRFVEMLPGIPLVNMRTRLTMDTPVSAMNRSYPIVDNTWFEGYEWNSVATALQWRIGLLAWRGAARQIMVASARPSMLPRLDPEETRMFGLIGTVARNGAIDVAYSGDLGVLHESAVTPDRQSDYALVFRDKGGKVVAEHGFVPVFATPDGKSDLTGISLLVPMPAEAAQATIERAHQALYSATCDGVAPLLSNATAISDGKDLLAVTWSGQHPQGRAVRYNIAFAADPADEPLLLATGLRTAEWHAPLSSFPGTPAGTFTIVASDGCNVAHAKTDPIRIDRRAPLARLRINAPLGASTGDPVTVTAVAWDHTDGLLAGASLRWLVDGVGAGSGDTLVFAHGAPAPGTRITLVAVNSAGLETSIDEIVR